MKYSDKQLKEATQIVYLSFLEKAQDNLIADGKKGPFSIRELIGSYLNINDLNELSGEIIQKIVKDSDMSDFDKAIIEEFSEEILEWKIIDIHDTNSENGFFGCVIETGEKDAIVAFRGSENMKMYSNLRNDWLNADFGLLNSKCTKQQKETELYADELIHNGILDKYDSISVTGHSLGGNLASHFTIAAAAESRKDLFNKIDKTINFDGPGVSQNYLKNYEEQINKASSKINHYKWSAVGSLLYEIPGSNGENIGIDEKKYNDNFLKNLKYKIITRHSTKSIVFDKNGNAFGGRQDIVSKALSSISKGADKILPESLTYEMYSVAEWIFDNILYEKEDGGIGFKNPILEKTKEAVKTIKNECKNFIGNVVNIFKEGALLVEKNDNEISQSAQNKKTGFYDVLSAMEKDYTFNYVNMNNSIDAFKNGRNNPYIGEISLGY